MTNLFLAVFENSISISILIVVLLLITPLLNKRYAAKWKYWIWVLLAVRLIIPFSGADMRTLAASWLQTETQFILQAEKSVADPEQAAPQGRIMIEIPAQMTTPIGVSSDNGEREFTLLDVTALVWMAGGMLFILAHMVSYAHYKRQALKRGTVINDNAILRQIFSLKRELRIKDTITVIEYPEADSPMVIGFLEPVLILPEAGYRSEELYFILKHELVHLKRRDVYMKLLLVAANAVHWFNPFVWIMQKEGAVDMELSCDERVTQGADYRVRKAYTETLLSTLHKRCAKKTVLSTQFYGGKQIMKKRFKNILVRTGKKNGVVLLTCAVILAASLGTLVGCSVTKESAGNSSGQMTAGNTEGGSGQMTAGNTAGGSGQMTAGNTAGNSGQMTAGNTEGSSGQAVNGNDQPVQGSGNDVSNTGNGTPAQPKDSEQMEMMVYIENFDGELLTFDRVEWLEVPGERAAELGITEDDAPSGFSVYNEAVELEEAILAGDCVCTILDWTSNYAVMQVTPEELKDILTEREGTMIPYYVTIKDNEVTNITEQYVP